MHTLTLAAAVPWRVFSYNILFFIHIKLKKLLKYKICDYSQEKHHRLSSLLVYLQNSTSQMRSKLVKTGWRLDLGIVCLPTRHIRPKKSSTTAPTSTQSCSFCKCKHYMYHAKPSLTLSFFRQTL